MGQYTTHEYVTIFASGLILFAFKFLFSDAIFDFIERRSLITQIIMGVIFVLLIGLVLFDERIENKKKNKAKKRRLELSSRMIVKTKGSLDRKSYRYLALMLFLPFLYYAYTIEYQHAILFTVAIGFAVFYLTYDKFPITKVEKLEFNGYVCAVCGNPEIEKNSMSETCTTKCMLIASRAIFILFGLLLPFIIPVFYLIDVMARRDPISISSIYSDPGFWGVSLFIFEITSIFTFMGFYFDSNEHRRSYIDSRNKFTPIL